MRNPTENCNKIIGVPTIYDPMLRLGPAAGMVGVTTKTMCAWRSRNIGPPYYVMNIDGKQRVLYRASEIEAWLQSLRVVPIYPYPLNRPGPRRGKRKPKVGERSERSALERSEAK